MHQPREYRPLDLTPTKNDDGQGRPVYAMSEAPVPIDTGPNKVLIGIIAGSVLLIGFGVFRMVFSEPEPATPKPQVESIWSQQQTMMREAMNMAREAQAMQQQHMQMMRAAAEEDYGYFEEQYTRPLNEDDTDW